MLTQSFANGSIINTFIKLENADLFQNPKTIFNGIKHVISNIGSDKKSNLNSPEYQQMILTQAKQKAAAEQAKADKITDTNRNLRSKSADIQIANQDYYNQQMIKDQIQAAIDEKANKITSKQSSEIKKEEAEKLANYNVSYDNLLAVQEEARADAEKKKQKILKQDAMEKKAAAEAETQIKKTDGTEKDQTAVTSYSPEPIDNISASNVLMAQQAVTYTEIHLADQAKKAADQAAASSTPVPTPKPVLTPEEIALKELTTLQNLITISDSLSNVAFQISKSDREKIIDLITAIKNDITQIPPALAAKYLDLNGSAENAYKNFQSINLSSG